MKCPKCGAEVAGEAVFCSRCGAQLGTAKSDSMNKGTAEVSPAEALPAGSPGRQAGTVGARRARADEPEQTLWEGGYSARAMIGTWITAACLTLAALIAVGLFWQSLPSPTGWIIAGVIVLIWLGLALRYLYRRMSIHYRLTNQRFFHAHGLLRRVTDRVEVIDINDVTFEQGVFDRMVGTGRIKISSSDKTDPELWVEGIENPRDIATRIDEVRRAERLRRSLYLETS